MTLMSRFPGVAIRSRGMGTGATSTVAGTTATAPAFAALSVSGC
jgi:hypothetical protein